MRKIIASGLALLLLVGMAGCSQEPEKDTSKKKTSKTESSQLEIVKPEADTPKQDVPSDEAIADDLRSSLATENQYAEITGIEMVKSLSEEGKYSATFTVQAATKYADWTYEADMKYTKYDQGWMVDSVNWDKADYSVSRTPNEQEMVGIANEFLVNYKYESVQKLANITYGKLDTENFSNTGILNLSWSLSHSYKHGSGGAEYSSDWKYTPSEDCWVIVEDKSAENSLGDNIRLFKTREYNVQLRADFSGIWKDLIGQDVTFSNVEEDSMDVTWGDKHGQFVQIASRPNIANLDLKGPWFKWYTDNNGYYLCMYFREDDTIIYIIRVEEYHGYNSCTVVIAEDLPKTFYH